MGDPHGPRGFGDPNAFENQRAFNEQLHQDKLDSVGPVPRPSEGGCGTWTLLRLGVLTVVVAVLAAAGVGYFLLADDDEVLALRWRGELRCQDEQVRGIEIDLELDRTEDGAAADAVAEVSYAEDAEGSGGFESVATASFEGRAADGELALFAVPDPGTDGSSYEARSIAATFDLFEPDRIEGTVDAPGCSSFAADQVE